MSIVMALKSFMFIVTVGFFLPKINRVNGHGRLIEPPSRASAWRYGFNTPHNYNDHELYCGGFTRQWVKNSGKCGVCGDPWDTKKPRSHEYGGTYGQGVVVRKYGVGATITIRVELTANHFGFFEFSVCPDYKSATQDCLDKNILKLVRPQENVDHQYTRYFPKEGNKVYELKYKLPKKSCQHCLLQWRYIAGNNWGNCPNGTGAVGCGPQEEFRACADIAISGKATDDAMIPEDYEEDEITTTSRPDVLSKPGEDQQYNPISALVISLVSFLVVFSILFLLYFHFYQVGRKIKNWVHLKTDRSVATEKKAEEKCKSNNVPLPPPRIKKQKNDGLYEISLNRNESLA